MLSNARRHLQLPASYIDNTVYQLAVTLDLGTLLSPSGLQRAASAVRHAVSAVTAEKVAVTWPTTMTRMRRPRWGGSGRRHDGRGNGHGLNERRRVVGGKGEWGVALGKMIRFR